MNSLQNEKIKSTLIEVEALQKEYEVTLQQYQEAGKNYITALQYDTLNPCSKYTKDSTGISKACYNQIWKDQGCTTPSPDWAYGWIREQKLENVVNDSYQWATLTDDNHRKGCYGNSTNYSTKTAPVYPDTTDISANNSYFTALKGRTWWGTAPLTEGPASTQKECETMCANSDKCSGATFNPVKRYCWARSGDDNNITPGLDDDYALISQRQEALSVMKTLNTKLLNLNEQIASKLSTIDPEVKQQNTDKNIKQQQLSESYQKLLNQKVDIDTQLQEYYSIDENEMNQSLYTNSQNISLRFWVVITSLVLLVTIKQFFGSESPPFSITIWLFIIIILIILTYTLNTPTGFMMLFLLLMTIIFMNS